MDRIIAANSVNLAGADGPPASGTPQYATDGNPALNIPATRWPAYQYNAIQEEIMNVLIAAGITPDKANNAQLLAALQSVNLGRKKLTANTVINIGGVGDPYATMSSAIAAAQKGYDLNGFTLTLKWNAGAACTENGIQVKGAFVGQTSYGSVILDFGGQQLSVSTSSNIVSTDGAKIQVQNVTLINSSINSGLVASNGGIQVGIGVNFGSQAGAGAQAIAIFGGNIFFLNNYTISGGANEHMQASTGGQIAILPVGGVVVTLTGAPAFATAFVGATVGTVQIAGGTSFVGSATGARYSSTLNGVINTAGGGANFFPGNSAGATATGGQYA